MNIAIYARVSTTDQNCAMQLRELRDYAGRQGWQVFQEYLDHGISGAKATRPALGRLMADARMKRFDAVVVWKIDRFGRSVSQLVENVQLLDSCGVRFIAITQGIDTDQRNPCGRLLLHILASLAEFERETILDGFTPASALPRPRELTADGRVVRSGATKRSGCEPRA